MTKQPIPETTDHRSIESIERMASVLANLSSELTELSSRLRSQTEATERDTPGLETTSRTRDPLAGSRERVPAKRVPVTNVTGEQAVGEPVDTSFARPARIPVAKATGSAPADSEGRAAGNAGRGGSSGGGGSRLLAWGGGSAGLLGLVVLVTIALARGWCVPLAQLLAGALLGAALFAGALWLHHRSTGRTV